jgi:glycosyltransferase involved in cell wall biosynthesis
MKVLIATPYFSPRVGGLETYALSLALELKNLGWEVVVVTGDSSKAITTSSIHGIKIYRLPIWKVVSNTPVNLGWVSMIKEILKTEKPDIINAHTPVPFMVDSVLLAAAKTPVIITYHAATLFKPSSLMLRGITLSYLMWEKILFRRARRIIAVSPYVAAALKLRFKRDIDVVSNAVSLPNSGPTPPGDGLVFVANLEPTHTWKGLGLILEALAELAKSKQPVPHLTIIGDGASRKTYEANVNELGIADHVSFTGRLSPTDRDDVMKHAAALIAYPTTANDAFPTVFLEAWALGIPVIGAAIGPIPSLIQPSVTGILVQPSDAHALSQALLEAFSDRKKLRNMGLSGRLSIETTFNWPAQAQAMSQLMKTVA